MVQSFARWMLASGIALAALASGSAFAGEVSDGDARGARAVIEAQLKALAAGDAELAFSYASPSIRMQFGDATSFIAMVVHGYPMVIRPAEVEFLRSEARESIVVQKVYLRDQAGQSWLATYQVQRQSDNSWRVNGCTVVPSEGKSFS